MTKHLVLTQSKPPFIPQDPQTLPLSGLIVLFIGVSLTGEYMRRLLTVIPTFKDTANLVFQWFWSVLGFFCWQKLDPFRVRNLKFWV